VLLARDVADVGYPDFTLEDLHADWATPGLDLERDAWVVERPGGEIVASALLLGDDALIHVHPDACGRGIGSFLAAEAERRATGDALRQEVMTSNRAAVELLERVGYEHDQRYWRMVRDLDGSEAPRPPEGVEFRALRLGPDDRGVYELVSEAMREIPGNTERTFEEWSGRTLGSALAPELSLVAEAGERLVGVALCERWEDGDGYVDYLAVAGDWRGRGLGTALLHAAFAGFAAAGLRRGVLWVNGRNESATRLYRQAGMEVAFSADRFVKRL